MWCSWLRRHCALGSQLASQQPWLPCGPLLPFPSTQPVAVETSELTNKSVSVVAEPTTSLPPSPLANKLDQLRLGLETFRPPCLPSTPSGCRALWEGPSLTIGSCWSWSLPATCHRPRGQSRSDPSQGRQTPSWGSSCFNGPAPGPDSWSVFLLPCPCRGFHSRRRPQQRSVPWRAAPSTAWVSLWPHTSRPSRQGIVPPSSEAKAEAREGKVA